MPVLEEEALHFSNHLLPWYSDTSLVTSTNWAVQGQTGAYRQLLMHHILP